jgi:hypothetical protein
MIKTQKSGVAVWEHVQSAQFLHTHHAEAHERPIFVIAPHRSGGTVLERALNAHSSVVIWGEHGGILNKLAELDAVGRLYWNLTMPLSERGLDQQASNITVFNPWRNPVDLCEYRQWCHDFIRATFTRDLPRERRWGLKEIRYHSLMTTRFLAKIFPMGKFVILRRDPIQICVSSIFADWSIKQLSKMGAGETEDDARAVINDSAYAAVAIDHQLAQSAVALKERCLTIWYGDLSSSIGRIFEFLELDPAPEQVVAKAIETRAGITNRDQRVGLIDRTLVEQIAPQAVRDAAAIVASFGVDIARLKRLQGGRYCFLLGDHDLEATPYSSMF